MISIASGSSASPKNVLPTRAKRAAPSVASQGKYCD